MKELQDAGLHETLYKARDIIGALGFTRHFHRDPDTGGVDIEGALFIALGAKKLPILVADVDTILPEANQGRFEACLALIESEVGDVTEWVDGRGTQEGAMRLLGMLGDEIAIA